MHLMKNESSLLCSHQLPTCLVLCQISLDQAFPGCDVNIHVKFIHHCHLDQQVVIFLQTLQSKVRMFLFFMCAVFLFMCAVFLFMCAVFLFMCIVFLFMCAVFLFFMCTVFLFFMGIVFLFFMCAVFPADLIVLDLFDEEDRFCSFS